MRYVGQQAEVTVALAGDPREPKNQGDLRQYFDKAYENLYGVRLDDMDVEVVSWRVTARGGAKERQARVWLADAPTPPKTTRPVYLDGQSVDTPVYDRSAVAGCLVGA